MKKEIKLPHYLILCHDKPNALELRMKTRPDHLEYLKQFGAAEKIGGPLLDHDGKPKGSAFIMDFDNLGAAEDFAKNDPYQLAGVFDRCLIEVFNPLVGAWAK